MYIDTHAHVHTHHNALVCLLYTYVEDDMIKVNQFVKARSHNLWFEAKLITGTQEDNKTVYCYVSPKVSILATVSIV